jgi:ferredoxin
MHTHLSEGLDKRGGPQPHEHHENYCLLCAVAVLEGFVSQAGDGVLVRGDL